MLRILLLLAFALPLSAAEPADEFLKPQSPPKPTPDGMTFIDQGKFDPRLKGYITPDGFKLEIVADESVTINPVGMTFDSSGKGYVLEWVPDVSDKWNEQPEEFTYKDGTKRKVATMKKTVPDVVKILTRDEKTGQFTKSEIIIKDELPSSILVHDGWIYLSGRGSIRRFKQSKPGGPYDVKEVIAHGFCGFHHHQVSGMTIGPDGWLYITSGDDDNYVEGSDGSRATVLRTGAVFRCLPDGSKMEEFSRGWRNPYRDLVYDKNFNWFHVDNDNEDGSKFTGCRLMHVAEGADFGWRLFTGARCCRPDFTRGAVAGELPGKLPPMLKTGRGSPAGLLIYEDTQLPEFYRSWLYYPDVFRKLIRAYKVKPQDSTFQVSHEFELLKSDDPLFRPCQMVTGPDGAIYIVDWRTDSGGAGKLFGDGKHGRIYRLSWAGGKVPGVGEVPAIELKVDQLGIPQQGTFWKLLILAQKLESFSARENALAFRSLVEMQRDDKNKNGGELALSNLRSFVNKEENPNAPITIRLGSLGALFQCDPKASAVMIKMLEDTEPAMRRSAAEYLGRLTKPGDLDISKVLSPLLTDNDITVRRAAALALGRIGGDGTADVLVGALKFDGGEDVYYTDGLHRAIERLGKPGMNALLEMANSGKDGLRDKAVAAFLAFRTREAAAALPEMLGNVHLHPEQRVELVKSYTNYLLDPPLSLDPLVAFIGNQTDVSVEVLSAAVGVLSDMGQLQNEKATAMVLKLLDSPEPEARTMALKAIENSKLVKAGERLLAIAGDSGKSADDRIAVLKAARNLGDKSGKAIFTKILEGEQPTLLRLEALRCLAVVDAKEAAGFAGKLLESSDPTLQREAVLILGEKPEGAKQVGEMFVAKKLPRDLLPQVSEAIRKHSGKSPELAKLLGDVMKGGLFVSLDAGQMEKVRREIMTQGDATRGRAVYRDTAIVTCMNCHKMEGVGGQVGPDLTRLWDTMSVEKVLETIFEPSKEIKEGFQSFNLTTKAGRSVSGLKVVDKPAEVVIRDANGRDHTFARGDIEELTASKISLMPENAVANLSYKQMLDLIAFLKNREMQESLRSAVTEFQTVGPFPNTLQTKYGPETGDAPANGYETTQAKDPVKWRPLAAKPNGYLDLREVYGDAKSSAYARVWVQSPKAQTATARLGVDTFHQVWLNGAMVKEYVGAARQAVPLQDSVPLNLKEGWNEVIIKAAGRDKSQGLGLFLDLEGVGLKTAAAKP